MSVSVINSEFESVYSLEVRMLSIVYELDDEACFAVHVSDDVPRPIEYIYGSNN